MEYQPGKTIERQGDRPPPPAICSLHVMLTVLHCPVQFRFSSKAAGMINAQLTTF